MGIANYKVLPAVVNGREYKNLRGPVNDVRTMEAMLLSYGFSKEEIKVLINEQDNRRMIEETFYEWLVKGTRPGDLAVFYFSRYGGQVPDYNGDEKDGLDEVIMPYDMVLDGGYNIIVDDELGIWLRKLEGRTVVMIIDACYSGGVVRRVKAVGSIESRAERYVPIVNYRPSPSVLAIPKRQMDVPEFVIFMSASRENEAALEVHFPHGFMGGFTFALSDAMKNLGITSYEKLFTHAKKLVIDHLRLPQEPQLEGNVTKRSGSAFREDGTQGVAQTQKPEAGRPQKPSWLKGEKVLLKIEAIKGDTGEVTNKIRTRLGRLPFVKIVNEGFLTGYLREKRGQTLTTCSFSTR